MLNNLTALNAIISKGISCVTTQMKEIADKKKEFKKKVKKENDFKEWEKKRRIKSNREKIDSKSWHTEVKDQSMSVLDAFPYKYVPLSNP